ncbi:hypothetical protein [endosymbiont GvMRE of Glomus versiforme]|uniref:hypothetical protein n=1 Tax=endosymbiont GvMRE of Glomus versiforme TaxID=2039283 RepID=UPI000ED132A9|nr:hypothetical protein [endosymbiont GvMRE of Glomus versiforme]RHZ36583.1 hypothetical protein GvMRE_I2g529 [endosymbiont GvMRE of Glomus versiforme]RHZ36917.1 hypothetical protein GvMRE_I2g639 [endosymbiont GvMRE of Glomus versiforme]
MTRCERCDLIERKLANTEERIQLQLRNVELYLELLTRKTRLFGQRLDGLLEKINQVMKPLP